MICRLSGRLEHVGPSAVIVSVGGVGCEVLVPVSALGRLEALRGEQVALHTILYLEGNPTGSTFIPRLVGFLAESDRAFFNAFIKVKGISMKKALRAMSVPVHQLAGAIEARDEKLLTSLPEIGRRTAAQIITDLCGKLDAFILESRVPLPVRELTEAQRVALEILVQWGDRRADAQRWVTAAVEQDPTLEQADAIVKAAYRAKQIA